VFYDRLVDDHDRSLLFSLVCDVTKSHMDDDFDRLFAHLAGSRDGGHVTESDLHGFFFCDFRDPKSDLKNYEEVRDVERLRLVVENYLDEMNITSKTPMNLVLFRSADVSDLVNCLHYL